MTYILAEIASAHMGDPDNCRELIMAAYQAKADGVKLQIWDDNDIKGHKAYTNLRRFELPFSEWEELVYTAEMLSLDIWAEVYSTHMMDKVKDLQPHYFKIAYQRFLKDPTISDTDGIPIFWRTNGPPPIYGNSVSIGEQSFPTTRQEAKKEIALIKQYRESPVLLIDKGKNYDICYADHQNAYGLIDNLDRDIASVAAVQAGAQFIEKHICLNREELKQQSRDYISALEPDEFAEYVSFMKNESGKIGVIL